MSRLLPAALVLGALTIAGCGSAGPAGHPVAQLATGTPNVASTPTPVPTATPDVIAIAGQAYLANVAVINAVGDRVNAEEQAIPLTAPFSALVPSERELLAGLQKWHAFTTSYPWPASVRTYAAALDAAEQTEITAIQEFVDDPTADTYGSLSTTNQTAGHAAAQLRLALYLPQRGDG